MPEILSRMKLVDTSRGLTTHLEKCPECRMLNQNFLIIPSEEIPMLGCLRCGLVFVRKEYIKNLDTATLLKMQEEAERQAAQIIEEQRVARIVAEVKPEPVIAPAPDTPPESDLDAEAQKILAEDTPEFACAHCGRVLGSKTAKTNHERACVKNVPIPA